MHMNVVYSEARREYGTLAELQLQVVGNRILVLHDQQYKLLITCLLIVDYLLQKEKYLKQIPRTIQIPQKSNTVLNAFLTTDIDSKNYLSDPYKHK